MRRLLSVFLIAIMLTACTGADSLAEVTTTTTTTATTTTTTEPTTTTITPEPTTTTSSTPSDTASTTTTTTTVEPTTTTTTTTTTEQVTTTTKATTTSKATTTTKKKPTDPTAIEQRASEILSQMTIEEKVGQMFIARCPQKNAASMVSKYKLGGYILFKVDFSNKSRSQVIADIQSYNEQSDIPLFIGVDEEGGKVNRVSLNPSLRSSPFLSPQELYSKGGFDLIKSDTKEKCELLKSLGINLNFAPVCDVSQNNNDFIYARTFGKDATQTALYVQNVVTVMKSQNMGCVLKHFPGYGNNADTHKGIAYDNRSYESFLQNDFLPFEAGVENGLGMIMVSHNVVKCMDSEYPASLSYKVHEILRNELSYDGVIITDDLVMDGIRDFVPDDEAAVIAVEAGNDVLCCSDFELQIPTVIEAVKSGRISEERIDESVMRILVLKLELGIIE